MQSLSRKGGQRPRPANWVAAGSSPAVLPLPDPKNQPGNRGWQTQLEQNWARGRQAARKQRWCRRPGFRRQQLAPQGAELTMRDVVPSPMPEVLFLLAKGGNGGKTIQWCPAAHTATKDLVHLKKKKKNQTNKPQQKTNHNPNNVKIILPIPPAIVSPVIIFTASFANNDFAFLPTPVCMLFRSAGAVAASPPTSHLSCPVSSSECPAAGLAGTRGAVGHLGLFPDSHQRLPAARLRGDIGSFRPRSIPIIKLGHFCTKGHMVL